MRLRYASLLLLFIYQCNGTVLGQQKKPVQYKAVCLSQTPSRTSMLNSSQKTGKASAACSKKDLSCCKGAHSRSTVLAASSQKRAKPLNKN